jgi:hypothetical protein
MTIRQRFKAAIGGIRRRRVEPGIDKDHPGVSAWDAGVIVSEAARRTFEDVQFYGPGADAANARRAATIARMDARIPAKEPPPPVPPTKKARRSKTGRLQARAEKLRAEIAALKGKK